MYDFNPLGPLMHLKELKRQAAPKLRPVRSRRQDVSSVTAVRAALRSLLRRLRPASIPWLPARQERST